MGKLLRFPSRAAPRPAITRTNGTVEIWPTDAMGGAWAVYHRSRSGDSIGHCGDFFDRADAEKQARAEADRRGALFDDGDPAA